MLSRQLLRRCLEQDGAPHPFREGVRCAPVHAVHPPGEQRDQQRRDDLRPGVPLQQDADGERGQHGDQQVAEAAAVADQRARGPGDDPREHDQGQGGFVEAQRRDRGGGAEPPRQPDAGHREADAPEGLFGGRRPLSQLQPPPRPQPGGRGDRPEPSDRKRQRKGVPHQRGHDQHQHDVQRLGERPALEQLTERGALHFGLHTRLVLGAARHRIHGHGSIWARPGCGCNIAGLGIRR